MPSSSLGRNFEWQLRKSAATCKLFVWEYSLFAVPFDISLCWYFTRTSFGYCPGSVPPIALLAKNVQVIIDSVVAKEGEPRSSAKQRFSHRVRLSPSTPGRHREVGAATPGQRRFVCGAGHPQLVFIASLDQLQQLTGPSTLIANVSNMKVRTA